MKLDEIRAAVASTKAADWHLLSGDGALTYVGRFFEPRSGEPALAFTSHERRAVLRSDIDVGLVWGLDADRPIDDDEQSEVWWAPQLAASGKRIAYAQFVEILYRGQPVDREVYALVDNSHGVMPWPATAGESKTLTVTSLHAGLVELLRELGAAVGVRPVEEYMRQCQIVVRDGSDVE